MFYPGSSRELGDTVDRLLAAITPKAAPCPKALIVPHAGYVYSGPIAASAFARVMPYRDQIERVVLIGPAHRVFVDGLAAPAASRLATPLGELPIDLEALRDLGVRLDGAAHAREHSLEVELPFLQRVAPHAKIIPLCGSRAAPDLVGSVLEQLWGGPETLIVISSDLSHYHPYAKGRALDEATCARILALEPSLTGEQACGSIGINGLAWIAKKKGLRAELLDLRSSGDTAGTPDGFGMLTHSASRDEVVGYAAFALYEAP